MSLGVGSGGVFFGGHLPRSFSCQFFSHTYTLSETRCYELSD
jgi:hypothetical protein